MVVSALWNCSCFEAPIRRSHRQWWICCDCLQMDACCHCPIALPDVVGGRWLSERWPLLPPTVWRLERDLSQRSCWSVIHPPTAACHQSVSVMSRSSLHPDYSDPEMTASGIKTQIRNAAFDSRDGWYLFTFYVLNYGHHTPVYVLVRMFHLGVTISTRLNGVYSSSDQKLQIHYITRIKRRYLWIY